MAYGWTVPEDLELPEDFELPDDIDEEGELLVEHYWETDRSSGLYQIYRYQKWFVAFTDNPEMISESFELLLPESGLLYVAASSHYINSKVHSTEELLGMLECFEGGLDPVEKVDGSLNEAPIQLQINGESWRYLETGDKWIRVKSTS